MSRRRFATLSERDGDTDPSEEYHRRPDDNVRRRNVYVPRGGAKSNLEMFNGIADQCGVCHRVQSACLWNREKDEVHPR